MGGLRALCALRLDRLPATVTWRWRRALLAGADQYLPYWDERPFLPSVESVHGRGKGFDAMKTYRRNSTADWRASACSVLDTRSLKWRILNCSPRRRRKGG